MSKPRAKSTASASSSLMQDVPGAFPATLQPRAEEQVESEDTEVHQTIPQIVYARRAEYVRPKHVRIKVGTWNVASFKGAEDDIGGWFVEGMGIAERLTGLNIGEDARNNRDHVEEAGDQEARFGHRHSTLPKGDAGVLPHHDQVGIYMLGLQEVVDISSASEALRPYTDPGTAKKWKDAMEAALPAGYVLVAESQLIGLLLLMYAHPDVAKDIKSVSTTSVGTGLMGYMGNKGAVTTRIVLGETTRIVFVNCHLAAGADKTALERRNWDAQQIVNRTRFEAIRDSMDLKQTTGEQIGEEDFAFWCGDLNYRLEGIPGDDVRRLLMLHTRNEYDLSQPSAHKIDKEISDATRSIKQRLHADSTPDSPSSPKQSLDRHDHDPHTDILDSIAASDDPTSLQTTLSSLLPHDELQQQMKARHAFHDGWQEGPITFLPTYKYDQGTVGVFDSSEKKRAPSWCDRILYRTRRDKLAYENTLREEEVARKKDEEMKANGTDQAASDEDILYDYDPDADGAETSNHEEYDENDEGDSGVVVTKEGFEDSITLESYTAHQRVLSSDHKPLDACFLLKYDAVVPDLKMKVHAEVARELDKQENDGRPNVVVVVDKHNEIAASTDECAPEKFEGVWFGDVKWLQSKHRSLTIANTSRVPATFSLIERPAEGSQSSGVAPKWLSIEVNGVVVKSSSEISDSVTLAPGETANVDLELRIVSMDDVKEFNRNEYALEDILVLRVENGRDHFIPIRGHWLESSLGRSINKLVRIPEGGIRRLQGQNPDAKGKVKTAIDAVTAATGMSTSTRSSGEEEGSASSNALSSSSRRSQDDPVRFSAPRELFRLTEAVEELSTRVIAAWQMVHAPSSPLEHHDATDAAQIAPWDENPAWPFDEHVWTDSMASNWETSLSAACDALDEDRSLEPSFPPELTLAHRLQVLSNLLLTFIRSMPDGIVDEGLWIKVESYVAETNSTKRKPSNDEQRTSVQEILSQSPSHSISFILVTSMLERILQERVASSTLPSAFSAHSRTGSRDSLEMPLSPAKKVGGTFKRFVGAKGASQPEKKKDRAEKSLAEVFAPAMVRLPAMANEKARIAREKKTVEFVEIFLKRDEPG